MDKRMKLIIGVVLNPLCNKGLEITDCTGNINYWNVRYVNIITKYHIMKCLQLDGNKQYNYTSLGIIHIER